MQEPGLSHAPARGFGGALPEPGFRCSTMRRCLWPAICCGSSSGGGAAPGGGTQERSCSARWLSGCRPASWRTCWSLLAESPAVTDGRRHDFFLRLHTAQGHLLNSSRNPVRIAGRRHACPDASGGVAYFRDHPAGATAWSARSAAGADVYRSRHRVRRVAAAGHGNAAHETALRRSRVRSFRMQIRFVYLTGSSASLAGIGLEECREARAGFPGRPRSGQVTGRARRSHLRGGVFTPGAMSTSPRKSATPTRVRRLFRP
jgi:hypothetical protein